MRLEGSTSRSRWGRHRKETSLDEVTAGRLRNIVLEDLTKIIECTLLIIKGHLMLLFSNSLRIIIFAQYFNSDHMLKL